MKANLKKLGKEVFALVRVLPPANFDEVAKLVDAYEKRLVDSITALVICGFESCPHYKRPGYSGKPDQSREI
jgi:hypothetical protein